MVPIELNDYLTVIDMIMSSTNSDGSLRAIRFTFIYYDVQVDAFIPKAQLDEEDKKMVCYAPPNLYDVLIKELTNRYWDKIKELYAEYETTYNRRA